MKTIRAFIATLLLIVLLVSVTFASRKQIFSVFANEKPVVTVSGSSENTENIAAHFQEAVPPGNVIDLEVYSQSGQKVWQSYTDKGGTDYTATITDLPQGTYTVSVGVFTPNWQSNISWDSNLASFTLPASVSPQTVAASVSEDIPTTEKISVIFSESVPAGNIVDIEVRDTTNNKIWQNAEATGGTTFSTTTSSFPPGNYSVSVGIFTPDWKSTLFWKDQTASFSIGQTGTSTTVPQVTDAPIQVTDDHNSSLLYQQAVNSYNDWKARYVREAGQGVYRVIRPENNNDTVSEGIGYGMLFSILAKDKDTFNGLWTYAQKYADGNGLMNWQIDSSGSVIGKNSAFDADEDMAYALLKADQIWPGEYANDAHSLIDAIHAHEISSGHLPTPGDGWGNTNIVNPSYLDSHYYRAFAQYTGNNDWNTIASTVDAWLTRAADPNTGLVPDWLMSDFGYPQVPTSDKYAGSYYYDAVRSPIRLLQAYRQDGNMTAAAILAKQNRFISSIGVDHLVSGYTLSGSPLTQYIDLSFLSSYLAASQVQPDSQTAQTLFTKVVSNSSHSYFGDSLRTFSLFAASGK